MDSCTYKIIAEITDCDFDLVRSDFDNVDNIRFASRCIVRHEGKIGVLFEDKAQCYLLPGGGIEPGESPMDACKREVREELGVIISDPEILGVIIERRSQTGQVKIEYVYVADAQQIGLGQVLDPKEDEAGMQIVWMSLAEMMDKLQSVKDVPYKARFVNLRLIKILEELS